MEATCQCGQLKVRVPGPTPAVVACHCVACQRRTGSPFGVAAYYPNDQVSVEGEFKRYVRPTALGGEFELFFCPACGTNLYFRGTKNKGVTGVAIGCFIDAHTMAPIRSVWEESKHAWVEIACAADHYPQGRP